MKDIKHIRQDFLLVALVMRQGWDLGVPWGVGDVKIFFFSKFFQIWCVSYLHEWHMHLAPFFWSRPPGALGRGQKVKYHLIWITKSISKIFKPNFVYLLTNERYITYHTGFSFSRLGHAQGWDLGAPWGVGVKKFFFLKFNQIWCVSYSHKWHMHQHNFFWSAPPWAFGRG